MTQKIRLLWCGESSHISSGFGNYTREVLTRLYNSGKYEIAELSCYRSPETPKKEPWKIYPVAVSKNDPLFQQYSANPLNQFGQWRFEVAVVDFKPHIVMDVRDFWNFSYQEVSALRPFFYWIISPTYDSSPPKLETMSTFRNADLVLFHTEWAKNDLSKFNYHNDINIGDVINDSVNPDVFKPIDIDRNKYDIPTDAFVVGSVMRNQKRKLIPDLLNTFRKLSDKYDNAILYLHTSFPEKEGWNLPALLLEFDIANKVYITYKCKNCGHFWPSVFVGQKAVCPNCKLSATICGLHNALSEEELVEVYNIFDIYVQYAICEGFGIPQVEAAACGLPVITINHGAMNNVGTLIGADIVSIAHEFKEMETEAYRVYPNNDHLLQILEKYYQLSEKEVLNIGQQTRANLLANFSWDKTAEKIMTILDGIDINQKLDWNIPERQVDFNISIPAIKNHREFIYYIIDSMLHDPFLKRTGLIESMIHNLDNGFVFKNNTIALYNKQNAVSDIEVYLNNKVGLEKFRTGKVKFPEDFNKFLNY